MFILKIRNADIAIIASNRNVTANLYCDDYIKAKIIIGVFKIKTNKNCSINNQTLETTKYYNKEIIFENVNVNFEESQLMNNTLELSQINEQDILIKELYTISNVRNDKSQFAIYIIVIIIIVIMVFLIFKNCIFATIVRVKRQLALGELRSHNPTASAEIRDNEHVHLERGHNPTTSGEMRENRHVHLERGRGPTISAAIQERGHLRLESAIQRQYAGNRYNLQDVKQMWNARRPSVSKRKV